MRVPSVLLIAAIGILLQGPMASQEPPPPTAFPNTVTVSQGPKTNLFPHVMKRTEVLAALSQVRDAQDLFVKSNVALTLRASSNTARLPWTQHPDADELWFIYRGRAKVSFAPFSLQLGVTPPGTEFDVGEGDVVNVPRDRAYQVMPASGRFEYVALRKFALQRANPPPLPAVTSKKQIDDWFAAGTAGTAGIHPGINRIIFDRAKGTDWRQGGAPGPWENHERNEHLSIVTYGTAKAVLDGFITGAHWDNRGVMGTGVVGGTEYDVGPGDLVFVFRNTAHFFDPTSSKFGYLLVDLPQSEPFWPKAVIPNGAGPY